MQSQSALATTRLGAGFQRSAVAGGLVALAGIGLLSSRVTWTLAAVAVAGVAVQVAVAWALIRSAAHRAALTSAFAVAWTVMFTFRLVQISVAPDLRYHHPAVFGADDATKLRFWALTTAAFVVFWLGVEAARRLVPAKPLAEVHLPRHAVVALFYVFLGISYAVALSGLASGFLQNVAQFYLFVIAYASYRSAEARRSIGPELGVVFAASLLALTFGYKEFAILPVLAWLIGQWAARKRVVSAGALAVVVIGAVFYVGIQAQRTAAVLGEDASFVPAVRRGLTEYDLATGTYLHKEGADIVYNAVAAVGNRLAGVDSLFVIDARTPSVLPFQGGRTLWQPALSTLPGTSSLLSPDFSSLSLGRYFTIRYWSARPDTDTSSQAVTIAGDFYLNWGSAGVIAGMLFFGLLYAAIDQRAPVSSATAAGLFAYAALPMLAIDRNVAYLLETAAIRYAMGLAMIALLRRWSTRWSDPSGGAGGRAAGPEATLAAATPA